MTRRALLVLAVLLVAMLSTTSWAGVESVSLAYGHEENPVSCHTTATTVAIAGTTGNTWLKFTDEIFSSDYTRYTLYAGEKGSNLAGLIRTDDAGGLWLGANYTAKPAENLTLILRPMKGLSDTSNRGYLFASYAPKEWGRVSLFGYILAKEDYRADVVLGPAYNAGKINIIAAPNWAKSGCWYLEVSSTVRFK